MHDTKVEIFSTSIVNNRLNPDVGYGSAGGGVFASSGSKVYLVCIFLRNGNYYYALLIYHVLQQWCKLTGNEAAYGSAYSCSGTASGSFIEVVINSITAPLLH